MWHFLSLLRVHFVWSVNVWKALKRYFSERTAACQQNHGGSLAGAFDLICRSAVMLWHFRHNSGSGQTNHLWYGKLAHFTFYLRLAVLTVSYDAPCKHAGRIITILLKDIHSANWTILFFFIFFASFFLLPFSSSSSSLPVCMHTSPSSVGVWRPPSPPPKCEMCGLNRFATNYTNFTSA